LGEAAAAEVAESIVRAATAVAGPQPGVAPTAEASTPDAGSGPQADR
jgi:hypothetical protein